MTTRTRRAFRRLLGVALGLHSTVALAAPRTPARPQEVESLRGQVRQLRDEVASLEQDKRRSEKREQEIADSLRSMRQGLGEVKERASSPVAAPFLSAPPLASDTVGVAKVAVFAPRLESEAQRRRDIVFLKVRRVEADAVRLVAELELPADQPGVDLPIDRSGALYILDWSTSDGNTYRLELKDGASAQLVASTQVKQLQSQGRFLFVGFRVE